MDVVLVLEISAIVFQVVRSPCLLFTGARLDWYLDVIKSGSETYNILRVGHVGILVHFELSIRIIVVVEVCIIYVKSQAKQLLSLLVFPFDGQVRSWLRLLKAIPERCCRNSVFEVE